MNSTDHGDSLIPAAIDLRHRGQPDPLGAAVTLTLAIAAVLVPGWIYLIGSAAAAVGFARRPLPTATAGLPVSVLKPLCGAEPDLYDNLRSFAEQDYPEFEIVLGVAAPGDTAVPIVRALIHDLPGRDIVLAAGPAGQAGGLNAHGAGANRKVANLENMLGRASGRILVLADSDMRVGPDYLAAVAAPLADPRIGLVTCLYRGIPGGGIWSRFGALHINFGFLPSALVGDALGWGGGCFGATIALERDVLAAIGGFASLRDQLADDHRLGEAVRQLGLGVHLSRYLVEARVFEPTLGDLWRHELRWARTVRGVAPVGFFGSVVAQPLALAALGAGTARFGLMSCALLAITLVLRWASARAIARALGFSGERLWLLPARDVLSFAVFVASLFGRNVVWRNQRYRVAASGEMRVDGDRAG